MIRKNAVAVGREIISAIRAGRLTRRQFDAWYAQRRGSGQGIVITLRRGRSSRKTKEK